MTFLTTKHKERCLAEHAAKTVDAEDKKQTAKSANEFQSPVAVSALAKAEGNVILASLNQDLIALKAIVDVDKKIELKKVHLIPKWKGIVDQYIANGEHRPFEPLVRFVIWLLDADQVDQAIIYADVAIKQRQLMPDGFKRDLQTFAAETIHDWAGKQLAANHSAEPYFSQMVERVESKKWLVAEPIALNRIYKLAGIFADEAKAYDVAEKYYLKCVDVNPTKHGVKGRLTAVQEKLGKA